MREVVDALDRLGLHLCMRLEGWEPSREAQP